VTLDGAPARLSAKQVEHRRAALIKVCALVDTQRGPGDQALGAGGFESDISNRVLRCRDDWSLRANSGDDRHESRRRPLETGNVAW
jgi:hypothetical protein